MKNRLSSIDGQLPVEVKTWLDEGPKSLYANIVKFKEKKQKVIVVTFLSSSHSGRER